MNTAETMEPGMMDHLKNNYVIQAWLVLLLAICFGASLAGVQLTLSPRIEANKINETMQKVPELVLGIEKAAALDKTGGKLEIVSMIIPIAENGKKKTYNVFKAADNKKPVGWVIKAKGQGYADKIELLLGLDPGAETITGLFIIDQKETPGLGNKIVDFEWRSQFIKKRTGKNLNVVKTGAQAPNDIDSITGATISSRAVCSIINKTVKDLKGPLANR
jgi:electron transport complex protein RnfG